MVKTKLRTECELIVEAMIEFGHDREAVAEAIEVSERTIRTKLYTIRDLFPDLHKMLIDDIKAKGHQIKVDVIGRRRIKKLPASIYDRDYKYERMRYEGMPTNEERIKHMDFYGLSNLLNFNKNTKLYHALGFGEDDDKESIE